jgi:hypothetical protein
MKKNIIFNNSGIKMNFIEKRKKIIHSSDREEQLHVLSNDPTQFCYQEELQRHN